MDLVLEFLFSDGRTSFTHTNLEKNCDLNNLVMTFLIIENEKPTVEKRRK